MDMIFPLQTWGTFRSFFRRDSELYKNISWVTETYHVNLCCDFKSTEDNAFLQLDYTLRRSQFTFYLGKIFNSFLYIVITLLVTWYRKI